MNLTRLYLTSGEEILAATAAEDRFVNVNDLPGDQAANFQDALNRGPDYLTSLSNDFEKHRQNLTPIGASDIDHYLPLVRPDTKIYCVGLNYTSHAEELGATIPKHPSVFARYASTCVPHGGSILIPRASDQVDWEAELAIIIGAPVKNVLEADAMNYVAGATCFNDVSIRDFQERLPKITLAKNFDASGPIGPWMTTLEDIPDLDNLDIELRVNGETMQQASTSEFIFSVPYLISLISQVCELRPGDVISTGTPGGVAWKRPGQPWLKPGDTVEVEISHIGVLRNGVAHDW